jgi:hypothetical protein
MNSSKQIKLVNGKTEINGGTVGPSTRYANLEVSIIGHRTIVHPATCVNVLIESPCEFQHEKLASASVASTEHSASQRWKNSVEKDVLVGDRVLGWGRTM